MKQTHIKRWLRLTLLFAAMIAFAVPKANAWNFASNTDPKKMAVYFNDNGVGEHQMTFDSSTKIWSYEFTADQTTLHYTTRCYWSDTQYNQYYKDEGGSAGDTWINLSTGTQDGKSYWFNNMTSGTKYRLELTAQDNDANSYKVRLVTAGPTVSSVEISKDNGTNWSSIENNSTVKAFENVTSDNKFLVRAKWSDNNSTYYYYTFASSPTATAGNYSITNGSITKPAGVAVANTIRNISMKVNVTSKTAATITTSNISTWPNIYLFNTNSPTLIGQMTRNGSVYTYTEAQINANEYILMSGQNTADWTNINNNRYATDKTSGDKDYEMPCTDTGVGYYTEDKGGAWKATVAGKYTITFNMATMKLSATVATKPISAISLLKNGTSVGSLKDNNSLVVSGIEKNDVFLVKVDYTEGDPEYYYYNGTFSSSNANATLTKGTSSSANWKAGDILKATFKITDNNLSKINITVAASDVNSWTYSEAAGDKGSTKTFNLSKSDKRGNTVYYGYSGAITTANTYTLSAYSTPQTVTINMANPSTVLSWSSEGVPTLTVTDLNAGITTVKLVQEYNNSLQATLTKHDGSNGTYFTWEGIIKNKDHSSYSDWTSLNFYLTSQVNSGTATKWTHNDNAWNLGDGSKTLVSTTNPSKYIVFPGTSSSEENSYVSILVTLKSADNKKLDKIYRGKHNVRLVGGIVGAGYESGDGVLMHLDHINGDGQGIYSYDCGKKSGDQYFRFYSNEKQMGHSGGNDQLCGQAGNATNWSSDDDKKGNTFKISLGTSPKMVTIWCNPTTGYVWYEAKDMPLDLTLNFKTIEDRADGSRSHKTVFLVADYLTNRKLNPDFEMSTEDYDTFTLDNVTLRGNTKAGNSKLYFVTIAADGTKTQYAYTPSASLLESDNENQFGRLFDIKYKASTNTVTLTPHESKEIPFISLVGFRYQQKSNEASPNNIRKGDLQGTERGWQESWILYDDNKDPFRDNDGNYMFNLQWPPRYPIQFSAVKDRTDRSKDFEMSSENIIFHPTTGADGKSIILTGANWKTNSALSDEAHAALRNSIVVSSSAPMNAPASTNGTMAANTKYMRYVINNAWVLGSTKLWTGWGGQLNGENAEWAGHKNWGFGTANTTDTDGTEISAETPYKMNDVGNFKFDNPTYFKTIEFYVPVNADGSPASGDAVFYTTKSKGEPAIMARSTKVDYVVDGVTKTPHLNNTGKFAPMFNGTYFDQPDRTPVASYRIVRYDGKASSSADPFESWKELAVIESCPLSVDQLKANYTTYSNGNEPADAGWFTEPNPLANGLYFYALELLDSKGNLIERVPSNTFSIANVDISPSINAYQLLELTKQGVEKIDTKGTYNMHWTGGDTFADPGKRWFVTFEPSGTGNYFVVNEENNKVIPIKANEALKAINDYDVLWTTQYFVRAGNVGSYQSDMKSAFKLGAIDDSYDKEPAYKLTYRGKDNRVYTAKYDPENRLTDLTGTEVNLVKSSNGTVGVITTMTEGSLDRFEFTSELKYGFKGATDALRTSIDNNAQHQVRPYVPGAYNLNYAYNNEQQYMGESDRITATLNTHSSVLVKSGDNAVIGTLGEGGAPAAGNVEKKMTVSSIKPRNLRCIFEFDRPNLSEALTGNYDIYYDILFTNNDDGHSILSDRIFADYSLENGKKCRVIANNVHPTKGTYPILAIKGTIYVPKGKYYVWNEGAQTGKFVDKPENPNENEKRQIIAGLEKLRELTESDFNSRYQMYHTPAYSVETVPTHETLNAETGEYVADETYRGLVLMCEGKNNTSYEKPGEVNFPISRFINWHSWDTQWFVDPESYGYRFTPNQDNTPGNFTVADNGDVIHSWTDEDGDHSVYLTPQYYDIEAYVPDQVGPLTYNETAGKWEGTNYYDKGALFKVVTQGSETYLLPDSDADDAYILANNFTVADDPVFIITPIYIFMRDPLMTGSTTTNDDYVGLVNFGANNHKQGDSQNAPAMGSAPRRAAGEGETINNGGTTTVNGKEIVVMRGGSATYAPASNQIFTEVQTIAAEPVDAEAEYYSLQGFRVVNPEAGQIYIVKRAGKVTRELVK